jgi:hypothetical protein
LTLLSDGGNTTVVTINPSTGLLKKVAHVDLQSSNWKSAYHAASDTFYFYGLYTVRHREGGKEGRREGGKEGRREGDWRYIQRKQTQERRFSHNGQQPFLVAVDMATGAFKKIKMHSLDVEYIGQMPRGLCVWDNV